ncbi:MAG: hypothetical protein GY842_04605 [bacterium]|nr:hypothetical protein [bacterium]
MRWNISFLVLAIVGFCLLSPASVSAEEERWIPVAASNTGRFGSDWATDLWINSQVSDREIAVTIAFLPDAAGSTTPLEATVDVPALSILEIVDVVGSLLGEYGAGALRLRSTGKFEVRSRTYTGDPETGTFGQGVPGLTLDEALEDSVLVGAANLLGPRGVRSNVGFVNPSPEPCELRIGVVDQYTGASVGTEVELELGPYGRYQGNVFELVGAPDHETQNAGVAAVVSPTSEPIYAYLSRIDNQTNDGTFMLAFSGDSGRATGHYHRLDFTLTYTDGVTLETLSYPGEDGNEIIVENPPSGMTEVLQILGPMEWCFLLSGWSSGGDLIEFVVEYTDPVYGESRTSRTPFVLGGPGHFSASSCTHLN